MSSSSFDKGDIEHQEAVEIIDVESQSAPKTKPSFPPPLPYSARAEFQKTLIGPAIGFAAFGFSSFVFGLYNSGLITDLPQVATGIAFGYGAVGQFTAGIIEIFHKNVFSAASFITFGSFFLSFAIMMVPGAGFFEPAYASGQLENCLGLIELGYAISAFIFFLGTLKQALLIRAFLFLTFVSFLLSAISSFSGVHAIGVAGGWCSFALGLLGWYSLAACIYNENNTYFTVPFF